MVPGVTAASAADALLGAPLMLDFAAISLSDLLVPWETIRRRLSRPPRATWSSCSTTRPALAAASRSRRRWRSSASTAPPDTPVGLVRDAYRPDQHVVVTTLGELPEDQVDMRTVVVDRLLANRRRWTGGW